MRYVGQSARSAASIVWVGMLALGLGCKGSDSTTPGSTDVSLELPQMYGTFVLESIDGVTLPAPASPQGPRVVAETLRFDPVAVRARWFRAEFRTTIEGQTSAISSVTYNRGRSGQGIELRSCESMPSQSSGSSGGSGGISAQVPVVCSGPTLVAAFLSAGLTVIPPADSEFVKVFREVATAAPAIRAAAVSAAEAAAPPQRVDATHAFSLGASPAVVFILDAPACAPLEVGWMIDGAVVGWEQARHARLSVMSRMVPPGPRTLGAQYVASGRRIGPDSTVSISGTSAYYHVVRANCP